MIHVCENEIIHLCENKTLYSCKRNIILINNIILYDDLLL